MKKYRILVYVKVADNEYQYKPMRPTNGEPYEYNSYDDAWRMLNICYPDRSENDCKIEEIE